MNIEALVLKELSVSGYASGEAISRKLHITRSAVWKHIVKLRERGYNIEASPRRGYRLVSRPDKLIPAEIAPLLGRCVIGSHLIYQEETGSTADEARLLASKGAPAGTVIIAEHQTAGRGRMGRSWQTPAGQAIAMSVILYPSFSPTQAPLLSLVTALATARAVESVAGVKAQLKWPNDIYLNDRKLGGVLVEMAAELDRISWVVDSIGLNVNNTFAGTELEGSATSLAAELGYSISRRDLTVAILQELDRMYEIVTETGFSSLRKDFEKLDMLQSKKVTVAVPDGLVSGVAVGIDESGCLLVRDLTSGRVHSLFSGEASIT